MFNAARGGSISFNLKSLKTSAQRQADPNYRMVFNAEADTSTNSNLYFLMVSVNAGQLFFTFNNGAAGSGFYYVIPSGQEDARFGNGVSMKVKIAWDGSNVNLYVNDVLVKGPMPYTPAAASWTANSRLILGGDNYLNAGVF